MTATNTKPHTLSVGEAVQRAQAERLRQYSAAVRATAEGRDVDPEAVAELLARLGIDVEKFTADAEAVAARIAADKALKEVPALRAQQAKIEAERDAARREWDAATVKFAERERAFKAQIEAKTAAVTERETAHRRAFETCPYPGVAEAFARATEAAQRARAAVAHLEELRASFAAKLRREPADPYYAQELEKCEGTLAERRGELADAEDELARAEAELMKP